MRCGLVLVVAAGCGFHSTGSSDAALPDGVVAEKHDVSSTELRLGQLVDMTIDASRAGLTPNAYTYGGLIGHGLQGTKLWSHGSTTWSLLDGKIASGAGLWHGETLASPGFLFYLGISDTGSMTTWFEGEVWLEQSSAEMFKLVGDDVAFFQIALPGTTTYTDPSDNNTTAIAVATPVTGWYPIRIGHTNGGGNYALDFTHSERGGALVPWTRDRLRARTSELEGVLRTVYAHQILGGGQGGSLPVVHFDENALLPMTSFSPVPQGAGNDDWSARYLGQVHVDQPGMYTLTITSDDGNRGRLGTGHAEAHWVRDEGVGVNSAVTPVSAPLAAGWNDLSVDYNQVAGARNLQVQIQGPDFAGTVEVPRERLRPVESDDDRLVHAIDEADHKVTDNGGAGDPGTATMTIAGYPGETVSAIELTYQVNSPRWNELKVDLASPGMTATGVTIRAQLPFNAGTNSGDHLVQYTIPSDATGLLATLLGPVNGDWKLNVYDVVGSGGDSQLKSARLTLHTRGGPDKIARKASWISAPLDLTTNLIGIDSITWTERVPAGAMVNVSYRVCQQMTCSDNPAWSDRITSGAVSPAEPGHHLQLRVEMTSNGALEPELRALSVGYRRIKG